MWTYESLPEHGTRAGGHADFESSVTIPASSFYGSADGPVQ